MGAIADEYRQRLDTGEKPETLKAELDLVKAEIRTGAGHTGKDWDIPVLHAVTEAADAAGHPTPLKKLRDAEVAAAHISIRASATPLSRYKADHIIELAEMGSLYPVGRTESWVVEQNLTAYREQRSAQSHQRAAERAGGRKRAKKVLAR